MRGWICVKHLVDNVRASLNVLIGWTINSLDNEIHKKTTFFKINVDVSTSTDVFFGMVCLIAVRRYWYTERRHTRASTCISVLNIRCGISLSVVRTLLDRSSQIVTEEEDREQEEHHIRTALTRCGYPDWSINQVKSQMLTPKTKKTTRKRIRQLSDEPKSTMSNVNVNVKCKFI